ncbi:hypothetical protein K432DRAFT_409185 [Lepidopterella palustris CBS 459.81]|uniref:FAD/NAD(P)-binding domain-containing protein n=1 Tax=Lepidopterella palustris CBS 459.81 TaxID=1314670 RepID=A0A8E2JAB8_9PEZI|nr:hypothetical protein K432DRAFT_409185 [Lepidopterella palustris CBS 459.81]
MSSKSTIFTNWPMKPAHEGTAHAIEIAKAKGAKVDERRIKKLVHLDNDQSIDIVFDDGSQTRIGFLAHKLYAELVALNVAKDLGVEIIPDGKGSFISKRNEPLCEKKVKGVFTAGDAVGTMKHFTVAMS